MGSGGFRHPPVPPHPGLNWIEVGGCGAAAAPLPHSNHRPSSRADQAPLPHCNHHTSSRADQAPLPHSNHRPSSREAPWWRVRRGGCLLCARHRPRQLLLRRRVAPVEAPLHIDIPADEAAESPDITRSAFLSTPPGTYTAVLHDPPAAQSIRCTECLICCPLPTVQHSHPSVRQSH
jgi:hypothetical protein